MGTTKEEIRSLFTIYGEIAQDEVTGSDGIELVKDKRYCYVSFTTAEAAARAVAAYQSNDGSLPKLLVKYAVLAEPKGPALEPPCTSSTADLDVPGLRVVENFLSEELEAQLLESEICQASSSRWEELLSRRIQHYGLIFNYRTLMLDYATVIPPIPEIVQEKIISRVEEELGSFYPDQQIPLKIQQMTVNEYDPGQGIANHIGRSETTILILQLLMIMTPISVDTDACLGPDLAIVSLGSGVVMTFQER
jgi:hypothetical protein